MREAMGSGMCSRRQRRLFQALLLLSLALGFIYGAVLYDDFRNQLKKAEAVATKHQQHQENLSAQLQVPSTSGKRPATKKPGGQEAAQRKQLGDVIEKIALIHQHCRKTRQELTQLRRTVDTLQTTSLQFQEQCEETLNTILTYLHTVPGTVSTSSQATSTITSLPGQQP